MNPRTNGATALAAPRHRPEPTPRRHLEVVPSRAQRRARPRLAHAVVTLAGVVAILLAQLGLSIALADGAYQIAALQTEQRELLRDGEALAESLESLQSPQYLAVNAEALGMVASGSLPYLDLTSGTISGRSSGAGGSMLGSRGSLVGNTTIDGLPLLDPVAASSVSSEGSPSAGLTVVSGTGASGTGSSGAPVSSGSGTLPSPTTR